MLKTKTWESLKIQLTEPLVYNLINVLKFEHPMPV